MRRFLILLLLVSLPVISLADTTLTLSFTGDVTLGSEEWVRPKENSFDSVAAREGYDYFFKNFTPLFSADDYTVVNLEGVLSDSPAGEKTSKQYRFRGPVDFADILVRSSIESVNVSNNHSQDYSAQGFEDTKNALTSHGVHYFGYSAYDILEKDGIRIGINGHAAVVVFHDIGAVRLLFGRAVDREDMIEIGIRFHVWHKRQAVEEQAFCRDLLVHAVNICRDLFFCRVCCLCGMGCHAGRHGAGRQDQRRRKG